MEWGHSSTSISAALGMSIGNKLKGLNDKTVAIIGDGAMMFLGMSFEDLSHAGAEKIKYFSNSQCDNDMSISENVGGLNNYFARIWASNYTQV